MFGKKKKNIPTASGYIGDLSEQQEQCFRQFKEWIITNNVTQNPWHFDTYLIRFCRARKFDLPKVIEMFSGYMKYREEHKIDTIIQDFEFKEKYDILPYYPRGYCGVDKVGRPIYIERSGKIQPTKIWEITDQETLWRSYYQSYESLQKLNFMACSAVFGKQIQHTFSILDLTGFSISMVNSRTSNLVQGVSKVSQDYYPEQLGQLMIVNAPMLFTGVWAVVKAWLDEKTREKIQIVGGGYTKKLLQYIDEDQLVDFLGGKNTSKIEDDIGPWNDFELVDGVNKNDVVGVRRKSDGPNGKLFTIDDFERMPNYMLPEECKENQIEQLQDLRKIGLIDGKEEEKQQQ